MVTLPWYAKELLLPPADLLLLALAGLLIVRWRPRLGRMLIGLSLVALYALSTPLVGHLLLRGVQEGPPLTGDSFDEDAGAIVLLSAGSYRNAPEYGGDTVDWKTLERLRYGVRLHRQTGAPMLVTGGRGRADRTPIGTLMAKTLTRSFGVSARWIEATAANTYENAERSAAILHAEGITKVYLVTHAWHMRRAKATFEALGFDVVPAPIRYLTPVDFSPAYLVPSARGLGGSAIAVHELIGLAWYRLAYF